MEKNNAEKGQKAVRSMERYNIYRLVKEDCTERETFKPRCEEGRELVVQISREEKVAQGRGSKTPWMGNVKRQGCQCGLSRWPKEKMKAGRYGIREGESLVGLLAHFWLFL